MRVSAINAKTTGRGTENNVAVLSRSAVLYSASLWPLLVLLLATTIVSLPAIRSDFIDDLDSAHHITSGFFFRDVIVDRPVRHPLDYALTYYKQYPALGFVFWPPLYPIVEGGFFLIGGLSLLTARMSLFSFTLMLVLFVYLTARVRMSRVFSASAAFLVLLTPLIHRLSLMIMLEVPVLAMAFLSVFLYQRLVRTITPTWRELLLFVSACTAAVYTKQTIVFLFPAFALDVVMNHRRLVWSRRVWVAAAMLVISLLPLAVFTLTVGRIGIQQSLGTNASMFVPGHGFPEGLQVPDRWSIAGWTYYLRLLPTLLNPLMLVLSGGAAVYGIVNRRFLRANALWFGWTVSWLGLFSWFLNKQPRHAALWIPGLVMLAVMFAFEMASLYRRLRLLPQMAIGAALLLGAWSAVAIKPSGFVGMGPIVRQIVSRQPSGNIAYFGNMRQLFVPYLRMIDSSRRVHMLQGDKLISEIPDIAQLCHDYQVAFVIMEADESAANAAITESLHASGVFHRVLDSHIDKGGEAVRITVYRYSGPMAATMRSIPLRPRVVDMNVVKKLED